ncbi:hypothetical protein R1flu_025376 [Riccia fluitans]|uniref:Uncharacterized protein n=1 Tax=Riccia fluitans TaxID=41844 RepID=A0ABD1XXK4_9MARC
MSCSLTAAQTLVPKAIRLKIHTVSHQGQKQPIAISLVHFENLSFRNKHLWDGKWYLKCSPAKGSDDNDVQPGGRNSAKGGTREWLQTFIMGRRAQNQKLAENLKRYGVAGILSYGLLNTAYYLVTFLFVWFYVTPSEGGLGFIPAAQRFVKVFTLVWAGSQVTKLIRAAGALTLAPFVDRGLSWYTDRFNFHSRGKAFGFIVVACIALAVSVFLIITTLWA